MENKINIEGVQYRLLDIIENIPIVDSFVKVNKLKPLEDGKTPGHGEARLYIGSQTEDNRINNFFDNYKHPVNCFFLKSDFKNYMSDAKYEYEDQEQKYNEDISKYFTENITRIDVLSNEILSFQIISANGANDKLRYYIRSISPRKDVIWVLFREITLPRITYVSILKLKAQNKETIFCFKVFLDYEFNSVNHPAKIRKVEAKIEKSSLSETKKNVLYLARKGQGAYREKLIENMLYCPFTLVTDERVLIASHIKPWSVADENEQKDPSNGILFTPTYDRLFDQGFISFEDDGKLLLSPYLSPLNRKRLGLNQGKMIDIKPLGKEKYLKYHRDNIFKK
jgi:putative restriction endonuclease